MRKHEQGSRLNFDFPPEAHKYLKIASAELGISIREFATQAILQKLQELEDQRDISAYDRAMERVKKNGTDSLEDVKKYLGLDV